MIKISQLTTSCLQLICRAFQRNVLAENASINRLLVPPTPGVLSAMGLMLAPVQHEALASFETGSDNVELKDLQSRINSFVNIGIELPTDDLLQVIISKSFSEKQVNLNPKITDYIIKNVDRSYEKMFKFLKDLDELSLSSGKSININLIKKVLNK